MLFFLLKIEALPPGELETPTLPLYFLVLDSRETLLFKYARTLSAGKDTQFPQLGNTMRPKKKKRQADNEFHTG